MRPPEVFRLLNGSNLAVGVGSIRGQIFVGMLGADHRVGIAGLSRVDDGRGRAGEVRSLSGGRGGDSRGRGGVPVRGRAAWFVRRSPHRALGCRRGRGDGRRTTRHLRLRSQAHQTGSDGRGGVGRGAVRGGRDARRGERIAARPVRDHGRDRRGGRPGDHRAQLRRGDPAPGEGGHIVRHRHRRSPAAFPSIVRDVDQCRHARRRVRVRRRGCSAGSSARRGRTRSRACRDHRRGSGTRHRACSNRATTCSAASDARSR